MSITFVQSFGGKTGLKNDNGYVCRRERDDTFLNGTSQHCTPKRRKDRHFVVCTAIQSASLDSSIFIIDDTVTRREQTEDVVKRDIYTENEIR